MRNAIRENYQLEANDVRYYNRNYYFDLYVLTEYKKEIDLSIYKYLQEHKFPIYEIVWNKDNKYVTSIEGKDYVLLKKTRIVAISYETLEQFLIPANKGDILPWHTLWMEKVDYYEQHIQTVDYPKLKESFFYYTGLTENAIAVYQAIKKESQLYISHIRLNRKEDFCNPMNFTLDYKTRDVSEYVKRLFFEDRLNTSDLFMFCSRNKFTEHDYQLLYARLLYPSYYFDCYDEIVQGEDEKCLAAILDKTKAYEIFLKEFYNRVKPYVSLPKVDWIVNNTQ